MSASREAGTKRQRAKLGFGFSCFSFLRFGFSCFQFFAFRFFVFQFFAFQFFAFSVLCLFNFLYFQFFTLLELGFDFSVRDALIHTL